MSYSSNPLLPKARAEAVRLVVEHKMPVTVAARRSGIHRSTLWRWKQRWLQINTHVQLENYNQPNRLAGSKFRLTACTWKIPTTSSRPHRCKHAVSEAVVDRIRFYRHKYGRCAVVVHAYCVREGTLVSLSTVRRVLDRLGLLAKRKWKRGYRPSIARPVAMKPGDLIQTDTVHLYDHTTKQRTYLYTLVDVYSRWSYSEHHTVLSQKLAAQVIQRGEAYAGFHFQTVQADNGPEYGRYFEELLQARSTIVRHSRVRRPNDNAHIERFNRTIQEECTGTTSSLTKDLNSKVLTYLAYYNEERLHLGVQCRTPREMLQRS
ncbi:MAG TPA: DDE-type integrase/transposase/recombinase [Candidatus Saccharimonadales bacterium]|nr:DDE-type integrase/transposase/recombinase [Candidatus Saccharimonadales bacterium]